MNRPRASAEIESRIFLIRGRKVMLDTHLAELYGVETKNLSKAAKRNAGRFPEDFLFQLTAIECRNLKFHIGTSSSQPLETAELSQGCRRALPFAFTQEGIAMFSEVLRSERAVEVNVMVMRTFVKLRALALDPADLRRRLGELEQRYERQFKFIFDAIRELVSPDGNRRPIRGLRPKE